MSLATLNPQIYQYSIRSALDPKTSSSSSSAAAAAAPIVLFYTINSQCYYLLIEYATDIHAKTDPSAMSAANYPLSTIPSVLADDSTSYLANVISEGGSSAAPTWTALGIFRTEAPSSLTGMLTVTSSETTSVVFPQLDQPYFLRITPYSSTNTIYDTPGNGPVIGKFVRSSVAAGGAVAEISDPVLSLATASSLSIEWTTSSSAAAAASGPVHQVHVFYRKSIDSNAGFISWPNNPVVGTNRCTLSGLDASTKYQIYLVPRSLTATTTTTTTTTSSPTNIVEVETIYYASVVNISALSSSTSQSSIKLSVSGFFASIGIQYQVISSAAWEAAEMSSTRAIKSLSADQWIPVEWIESFLEDGVSTSDPCFGTNRISATIFELKSGTRYALRAIPYDSNGFVGSPSSAILETTRS
jgi:hypothetical protein